MEIDLLVQLSSRAIGAIFLEVAIVWTVFGTSALAPFFSPGGRHLASPREVLPYLLDNI